MANLKGMECPNIHVLPFISAKSNGIFMKLETQANGVSTYHP